MDTSEGAMNKSKIQILDQDGFILKEFDQDQSEQAYRYAEELEAMDIEVHIKAPSLARTLAESLGAKQKDLALLDQELIEELEDHIPNKDCGLCQ